MAYCILCGDKCRSEYFFCSSCYSQYKDQPFRVEIDDNGYLDVLDTSDECFICGEETDGYFFCKSCYHKYKNKTIFLSVKNCDDVKVLDTPPQNPPALFSARSQAKFEAAKKYSAKDGHAVRSTQELIIDDLLYDIRNK